MTDAREAFEASTANWAIPVQPPTVLRDEASGTEQVVAEILLYGDCVLRFVSGSFQVGHAAAVRLVPVQQQDAGYSAAWPSILFAAGNHPFCTGCKPKQAPLTC